MRHLGVAVLFLGLAGWFGYDGFVRYPSMPARDIYVAIEKSEPNAGIDLEDFKAQKIKTQYGFTAMLALVALVVGLRLWRSWKSTLEWDDEKMLGSLTYGKEARFSDVKSVDRRHWAKKGILRVTMNDGRKITLDSWHHPEAKEIESKLPEG